MSATEWKWTELSGILPFLGGFALAWGIRFFMNRRSQKTLASLVQRLTVDPERTWDLRTPAPAEDPADFLSRAVEKMRDSFLAQKTALEKEKDKLTGILENLSEGVIAVDASHQIVVMNRAAREIFHVRRPSTANKSLIEVTMNTAIDRLASESMKDDPPLASAEIEWAHPERKVLKVHALGLGQSHGDVHAILVLHDITRMRELENMRREFVANVSHELKTPLTSINGFLETLLGGAAEDREKRGHFLKIIQEDADRLQRLLDDLLEISKIESREILLKPRPVKLRDQIKQILLRFESQIASKNITVENGLEDQEDLVVHADPDKLRQVLINLLDNACKFNKPNGCIRIRARKNVPSHQITVTVEDTGMGIPKEAVPRIFERFFRVDKARSRELGGTGLGLSIVKHLIEAHGGKVSCESRPQQGTKMSFTLPSGETGKAATG